MSRPPLQRPGSPFAVASKPSLISAVVSMVAAHGPEGASCAQVSTGPGQGSTSGTDAARPRRDANVTETLPATNSI